MAWLFPTLFVGLVVSLGWLDPRHLPRRSELGHAMQRVGRRGRLEVRNALRDGRAVNETRLAALAAAVAQDRMSRIDYRGPLLTREKVMVIAVLAESALAAALGLRDLGATFSGLGASTIVVFWVVGLRRVTPSHLERRGSAWADRAGRSQSVRGRR
jgi:hypothetical protein